MRFRIASAPYLHWNDLPENDDGQRPSSATHVAAELPHGRFRRLGHAGRQLQIEEHHAVRRDAGMFDVSHMLASISLARHARRFLRGLIANDVAKLTGPGSSAL